MRAVLQRVREASVTVDGRVTGSIGEGLLVLAGFGHGDSEATMAPVASKIVNLRIFEDDAGRMNLSLLDRVLPLLVVSQFTLYADCRKGRRPSFTDAAPPREAERLYTVFVDMLRSHGPRVETGEFGAMMEVRLLNWGPVTVILDSSDLI